MTPIKIPNSSVVKNTARTALSGRWPEVITVCGLGIFAIMIVSLIPTLILTGIDKVTAAAVYVMAVLAAVLVVSPLLLGIVRYFWRLTDSACDYISSVFYYFGNKKSYFRCVKLTVMLGFRVVLVTLVCLFPYLVTKLLSGTWVYQQLGQGIPLWATNLMLIKGFLYVVGIVFALLFLLRYYLVPIIVVMDDDLLLLEAVHISTMVAKMSASAILSLCFSLIGWILLSLFILPTIYTLPLLICCYVIHSRFAIVNYNLLLDYYENDSTMGRYV